MNTILKNVVQFAGLLVGVPTSLPHGLNIHDGTPIAPQLGGANASGFVITADTVNVTVTRTVAALNGTVDVYVEHWHTIEEVLPLGELAGLTPFFFANGGGAGATTLNPAGLPEQWAVQDVPANTAATAMSAQVSTNFDTIKMMRSGFLVGISARLTEAVTAGTVQVDATINGVVVAAAAMNVTMAVASTGGQTLALFGAVPYVTGDLIGIKFTTSVGFTPTTTDLEAWLEVVEVTL